MTESCKACQGTGIVIPKKPTRFIVEAVWSGYRSSQSRPCHRRVVKSWEAEALAKVKTVAFTDGTTMSVTVRPCAPREKVQEIHGYDSLFYKIRSRHLTGYIPVEKVGD